MTLFLTILLFVFLVIYLILSVKAKIIFSSNINEMNMKASLFWLYPFFKADIIREDSKSVLIMYIFNKKIYNQKLQNRKHKQDTQKSNKIKLIKSMHLSDVDVEASYGFLSPFVTGIACGVIGIITQYIDIDSFEQKPDFMADDDYIYVNAKGNLNIGLTLLNMIRA